MFNAFTVLSAEDDGIRIQDDRTGRKLFIPVAEYEAISNRWEQDGRPNLEDEQTYKGLVIPYMGLLEKPKKMAGLCMVDRRPQKLAVILALLQTTKDQ